jgi:hypothetical protein
VVVVLAYSVLPRLCIKRRKIHRFFGGEIER